MLNGNLSLLGVVICKTYIVKQYRMSYTDFIIRLGVAFIVGFAIGVERELAQKEAGLRTNLLVCMGAAIYVLVSLELTSGGTGDPSRVVGEVTTGIGFLGAGVILHQGINVHGLTTAATVWCTAALGCLSAGGFVTEALTAGLFILLINAGLMPVSDFLAKQTKTLYPKQEKKGKLKSSEDFANPRRPRGAED
jgi:putative Mg2+ transporter-C (MgtC) family protein